MKEIIKNILKSCVIGKLAYEPLHRLYRLYSVPRRRRILKRYGAETLAELARQFKKHGIPGYAAYGTMLGFVRDNGFIPHDDDVDVAILPNSEWNSARVLECFLAEEGFSYVFGFKYDDELVEFKLMYHKIPIDFFFPRKIGDQFGTHGFYYEANACYPTPQHNTAKLFKEPQVKGIMLKQVLGVDFPIPQNYEEVLEGMYGKNWRIPDAAWVDDSCPGITDLPNYGLSVSREDALS